MNAPVPFTNLPAQHAALRAELLQVIGQVIDSGVLVGGPQVAEFEQAFAAACGAPWAVGVGSGTEALWLSLMALGVGPGDEVITVPLGFAATVEAICWCGAKPVLVDIEDRSYTMDPAALAARITHRTKAIIPVHLFGQTADMAPIITLARSRGLRVVEDAAQAHGASYFGERAGNLGDAGCFSFYPTKNLGALGEGGAVVTGDAEVVRRLRCLRDHGQASKNRHTMIGWNSRLDALQAAVLEVKLRLLDHHNQLRRAHARRYHEALADLPAVRLPEELPGRDHVYHLYAIRVEDRRRLLEALDQHAIGYGLHYPVPIHLQPVYQFLGYRRGDFPVAERCAAQLVSLPMFPELSAIQIASVVEAVRAAMHEPAVA